MEKLSLIFDLDGTLVDTAPDLLATLNRILSQNECNPITDLSDFRYLFSYGAKKMLEAGFEKSRRAVSEERLLELFDLFIEDYSQNIAIDSAPFPGVLNALPRFQRQGAILGVCTNKREKLSIQLLNELGMASYFGAIVGADTLEVRKPDPGHLTGTISQIGGDVSRAIMIGDSANDILTAQAAQVPVIAVTYGYADKPLHHYKPDAIIDNFDQLEDAIADLI